MKKKLLSLVYNIIYKFENQRDSIPDWWYDKQLFDKLTPSKQRVRVAQDVIKQIDNQVYYASKGKYVAFVKVGSDTFDKWSINYSDVQKSIPELEHCECCALGACIVSITKFKNKLSWSDVMGHHNYTNKGTKVLLMLNELFTAYQLSLIEAAFEGNFNDIFMDRVGRVLGISRLEDEDNEKCLNFFWRYDGANSRLKAIMENIVINKGEFKP